jgi:hypothetical protein
MILNDITESINKTMSPRALSPPSFVIATTTFAFNEVPPESNCVQLINAFVATVCLLFCLLRSPLSVFSSSAPQDR